MVIISPLRIGWWDPFQIAMNMAYFHGGDPITTSKCRNPIPILHDSYLSLLELVEQPSWNIWNGVKRGSLPPFFVRVKKIHKNLRNNHTLQGIQSYSQRMMGLGVQSSPKRIVYHLCPMLAWSKKVDDKKQLMCGIYLENPGCVNADWIDTVDGSEIPRPTTWDGAKTLLHSGIN